MSTNPPLPLRADSLPSSQQPRESQKGLEGYKDIQQKKSKLIDEIYTLENEILSMQKQDHVSEMYEINLPMKKISINAKDTLTKSEKNSPRNQIVQTPRQHSSQIQVLGSMLRSNTEQLVQEGSKKKTPLVSPRTEIGQRDGRASLPR